MCLDEAYQDADVQMADFDHLCQNEALRGRVSSHVPD
jgi:hypothetical protein